MNPFITSIMKGSSFTNETTEMFSEDFVSTLPSGWNALDASIYTINNGIEATGVGGMDAKVQFGTETFLDRCTLKTQVIINDVSSKFSLMKQRANRGTIATVDLTTSTLYLGVIQTDNVEPTYEFSTPIDISIISGQTYILELTKNRNIVETKFYNNSTPSIINEIVRNYDIDNTFAGSGWGKPRFSFFSGNIKIKNISYTALNPQAPHVAMYGDSQTEGFTMIPFPNNVKNRWADKVWVVNKGNAYISAKGGLSSGEMEDYLAYELTVLDPTYVIVLIGSNDSDFTAWQTNLNTIIGVINSAGSTPVLCTIMPRNGVQDFLNEANAELLDVYSLTYDIIDMAGAVTTNRDRLNWIPEFLLDGVHPTVSGHQAMYDEIVNNNTYLLN